jgi:uncharacterized protein YjbI with pentapeptide repeats
MSEIANKLKLHSQWLKKDSSGARLEEHCADLRGADLRGADMCGARGIPVAAREVGLK